MAEKLTQIDKLLDISFSLTEGGKPEHPRDTSGRYPVILFYRGNW